MTTSASVGSPTNSRGAGHSPGRPPRWRWAYTAARLLAALSKVLPLVHHCHDMGFRRDVQADDAHGVPFRQAMRGASEPVLMLGLVNATTPLCLETVRVLSRARAPISEPRTTP